MLGSLSSISSHRFFHKFNVSKPVTFSSFPSGLVTRYDFSDPQTLLSSSNTSVTTNGEYVNSVLDKSTNGYTLFSRGSTGNVYNTSGLGVGKQCLTVYSTSATNGGYYTNTTSPPYPKAISFFVVLRPTTSSNHFEIWDKTGSSTFGTANNVANPIDIKGQADYFGDGHGYYSTNNINEFLTAQSTPSIFEVFMDPTNGAVVYLNGTLVNSGVSTFNTVWADSTNPCYLFMRSDQNGISNAEIGELLSFNNVLSSTDRQLMEGYLATKFGIQSYLPPTHPFYTSPATYTGVEFVNFPSGLVTHYDMTDSRYLLNSSGVSVTANGTYVYQIKNKASTSYNMFSRGETTDVLHTSGLGIGKQCIYLSGSSGSGQIGYRTNDYPPFPNGISFFCVARATLNYSYPALFNKTASNKPYPFDIRGDFITLGNNNLYYSNTTNYNELRTASSTPIIYAGFGSNNQIFLYVNGTLVNTIYTGSYSYQDSNNYCYIGSRADSGVYFPGGEIGEMVAFNGILSTSDRQMMEGYLATKFGIQSYLPSSHPYYSTPIHYIGSQ